MRYKLEAGNHHLIHILRFMMVPEGIGVLDRTWEFQALLGGGIAYPYRNDETPPNECLTFPEFDDKTPFQVSGIRLVERAALVFEFDETVVVRLCEDAPDGFDLLFFADLGHPLIVETSDEDLYQKLKLYFESTSGEAHANCFR